MDAVTTHTSFGIVTRDDSGTAVFGSNLSRPAGNVRTLREWATQPGSSWPCSQLARVVDIAVKFDVNGDLVDLSCDTEYDLMADEVDAWSSECLIRAGYPYHPALR